MTHIKKAARVHDIRHMKVVRSPSRTGHLYPQKSSWYSFSLVAESAPVRRNMSLKNPVTPLGFDPRTVRLVAQRLNHYATPGWWLHLGPVYIIYMPIFRCCKANQKYILWWLYLGVVWPNRTWHKQAKPSITQSISWPSSTHPFFWEMGTQKKIKTFFFCRTENNLCALKFLSPTTAPLYYTYKMLKCTVKISHDCSYMFRSRWTIIREPMPNLAKVTVLWT
jgi:hypothetical protein